MLHWRSLQGIKSKVEGAGENSNRGGTYLQCCQLYVYDCQFIWWKKCKYNFGEKKNVFDKDYKLQNSARVGNTGKQEKKATRVLLYPMTRIWAPI